MTQDEYQQWATHHAALFGFNSPTDAAMFEAWWTPFTLAGYSAGELMAASNWMATSANPVVPGLNLRERHLLTIRQRVTADRLALSRGEFNGQAADSEFSSCSLCTGSGLVIVPDPRSIVEGRWVNDRRAAVTCRCQRGERLNQCDQNASQKDRRFRSRMRLQDYENRWPLWSTWFAKRERENSAFGQATDATRETVNRVVSKLARKTQIPKEETSAPF